MNEKKWSAPILRVDSQLKSMGITWAKMGRDLGVVQGTLTNWKKRGLSKDGARDVAAYIGKPVDWILDESEIDAAQPAYGLDKFAKVTMNMSKDQVDMWLTAIKTAEASTKSKID